MSLVQPTNSEVLALSNNRNEIDLNDFPDLMGSPLEKTIVRRSKIAKTKIILFNMENGLNALYED